MNPRRWPRRRLAFAALLAIAAFGLRPARTKHEARPAPPATAAEWARQGDLAFRNHHLRQAEHAFLNARRLDPEFPPALVGLTWVHALQMRRDEALADFRALAACRPLTFDQVLLWTKVRCGAWDPDQVTGPLRACLDRDPDDRWVRLALAEGLRRNGRGREADEVLHPLPASDPDALVARARLAIDQGDFEAARLTLAQVDPCHAEAAELLGRLALARHDAPAGVAWYRRSLASDPGLRRSRLGLAQALRLAGMTDELPAALEAVRRLEALENRLKRAAETNPKGRADGALLRGLGEGCEALGYRDEARAWYELAIALGPLDPLAQAALFRLRPPAVRRAGESP